MPTRQAGEAGGIVRVRQRQVSVVADRAQEETQAAGTRQWGVEVWQSEAMLRQLRVGPAGKAAAHLGLREEGGSDLVERAGAAAGPREGGLLRREAGGAGRGAGEQLAGEVEKRLAVASLISASVVPSGSCEEDGEVVEIIRGCGRRAARRQAGRDKVQPLRRGLRRRWRRRVASQIFGHTDTEQEGVAWDEVPHEISDRGVPHRAIPRGG